MEAPILNQDRFHRMACGDLESFFELAKDYFDDIRTRIPAWIELHTSSNLQRLREEFHRCKGGAAIFGFERLHGLLSSWEKRIDAGESDNIDLDLLIREFDSAEAAIAAMPR